MKISRPSPAMAVACTALFIALGGTSIAAVNYARNAGAVDGRSAVRASSTTTGAAGKLVATNASGPDKGQIPSRFLTGVAKATSFGSAVEVVDNAVGTPATLGTAPGIGTLTASCADQSNKPGIEDPITTITLNNSSGTTINIAKRVGGGNADVVPQAPNTAQTITIGGSNTFELHAQNRGVNLVIHGVIRQDGRGTAAASCLFYGTFTLVE
jgi:hypothetical protein